MKRIILALAVLLVSCGDQVGFDLTMDAEPDDASRGLRTPDQAGSDGVILDASPDVALIFVDADLDASPPDAAPPIVCEPYGLREDCNIEGLEGPCATGVKICHTYSWSQCSPATFPRTEVCDNIDNDCDGNINEAPPEADPQHPILFRSCYDGPEGTSKNGPCRTGISICTEFSENTDAGLQASVYRYGECQNQILPEEEVCDSADNDCDDNTDEGVLNACEQCGDVPEEVCDTVDNDCDGSVDENLLNACMQCGEVPSELCDFIDNDCDGVIDEEAGNCECDNPLYVPQLEVCNGLDEDCDQRIDEGPDGGPLTKLCSTDNLTGVMSVHDRREDGPQYAGGECRLGIAFCEDGFDEIGQPTRAYFECIREIIPGIERCNDEDDDCDGVADEDFEQGRVAVMMVVDVSGSMNQGELAAAFEATRNSVQDLFDEGVVDVCYMLAVVGNDNMPDPYLFYPGDMCVPGVEDPQVVPIEDMSNAVNTLRLNLLAGTINQGGATENTLDAIGRFFTDDLIDWDNDGIPENILWNTNRPQAQIQGIQDQWDVDLSQYTHRIVIVLGDEPAQGEEWGNHDAARAMAHAGGMVFIIGTRQNVWSYQPLIDFGAVHSEGLDGFAGQNEQQIEETIAEAIEEAACINARQQQARHFPVTPQYFLASLALHLDYVFGQCF